MGRLIAILLMTWTMSGCAMRKAPIGIPVNRLRYGYVQTQPGIYLIFANDDFALRDALKEIGCGPCINLDQWRGEVITVKMFPKK